MKEIRIRVRIVDGQLATLINHKGYSEGENVSKILETIGVLDNIKQQQLDKLKHIEQKIK